ncbi:MAG: AMP-binding protein [Parvularculaceae bacterium]
MSRPGGRTLAETVLGHGASTPEKTAIYFRGEKISYAALSAASADAAKAMLASGVRNGDRVALLMGNEPQWVVFALAASMIGAVFCPLNTWYKAEELYWTLKHSSARLVISAPRFLKTDYRALFDGLAQQKGDLGGAEIVFVDGAESGGALLDAFLSRGASISDEALKTARAAVDADTPAFFLYTSGSTAEPKGVLLNHRGVVENGYEMAVRRGINGDDRVWLGSPLFYGLGATNALPATFTVGAGLVLQGHFDAGDAIETIRRTGATVFYGTGNMTRAILDHPDYAYEKIATLKKGNAGTVAEYKRLMLVELGVTGAVPAYGLTECYGNATVGEPDDPIEAKINTNGRPLPGMELKIVDPQTGEALSVGETGLVLLRGRTPPGYLNNPEETAKALRSDGWFDTGDLGSLDADGRFIFSFASESHQKQRDQRVAGGIEQLLSGHKDDSRRLCRGRRGRCEGRAYRRLCRCGGPGVGGRAQSICQRAGGVVKTLIMCSSAKRNNYRASPAAGCKTSSGCRGAQRTGG